MSLTSKLNAQAFSELKSAVSLGKEEFSSQTQGTMFESINYADEKNDFIRGLMRFNATNGGPGLPLNFVRLSLANRVKTSDDLVLFSKQRLRDSLKDFFKAGIEEGILEKGDWDRFRRFEPKQNDQLPVEKDTVRRFAHGLARSLATAAVPGGAEEYQKILQQVPKDAVVGMHSSNNLLALVDKVIQVEVRLGLTPIDKSFVPLAKGTFDMLSHHLSNLERFNLAREEVQAMKHLSSAQKMKVLQDLAPPAFNCKIKPPGGWPVGREPLLNECNTATVDLPLSDAEEDFESDSGEDVD